LNRIPFLLGCFLCVSCTALRTFERVEFGSGQRIYAEASGYVQGTEAHEYTALRVSPQAAPEFLVCLPDQTEVVPGKVTLDFLASHGCRVERAAGGGGTASLASRTGFDWVTGRGYFQVLHFDAHGAASLLVTETTNERRARVFRHPRSGKYYGFPLTRSALEELFGTTGSVNRGTAVLGWR
jgi:hypothetical protein